jgi:hypothetical protein
LFVAALLFLGPVVAAADTYSIQVIAPEDRGSFVAGDDFGDYVISLSPSMAASPCGATAANCYATYSASTGETTYSATIPTLATDPSPTPGSGCVSSPSDFFGSTWCDNGHEVLAGVFSPAIGPESIGTFDGSSLSDLMLNGVADQNAILTANGDFFFDDATDDNLVEALDVNTAVTPEPSSLALAGTGALVVLEVLRRRRKRNVRV